MDGWLIGQQSRYYYCACVTINFTYPGPAWFGFTACHSHICRSRLHPLLDIGGEHEREVPLYMIW